MSLTVAAIIVTVLGSITAIVWAACVLAKRYDEALENLDFLQARSSAGAPAPELAAGRSPYTG